jgi:hypothetical protein
LLPYKKSPQHSWGILIFSTIQAEDQLILQKKIFCLVGAHRPRETADGPWGAQVPQWLLAVHTNFLLTYPRAPEDALAKQHYILRANEKIASLLAYLLIQHFLVVSRPKV